MTKAKIGDTGTLKQLGVQVDDVVECIDNWYVRDSYTVGETYRIGGDDDNGTKVGPLEIFGKFKLISRATPEPTIFDDMTDAEQGALLLAKHRGEVIQCFWPDGVGWRECEEARFEGAFAYRVKSDPVVKVVVRNVNLGEGRGVTHELAVYSKDGEIDCASAVLVKL